MCNTHNNRRLILSKIYMIFTEYEENMQFVQKNAQSIKL